MPYASVNCPKCGLKSNLQESSVGTMRRCQNCGHKFIIQAPKFSIIGCLVGALALCAVGGVGVVICCGGLSFIGSRGPARPPVPVATSIPAKGKTAGEVAPQSPPAAEVAPVPPESKFDASTITLSNEETTERTRTFQSTDGKFTVDAILIAMRDEVAYLKKTSNAEIIEVPMAKLSNSDRIWIRRFAATDKKKSSGKS